MGLFAPGNTSRSPRHEWLYAAYEVAFTAVDFLAAFLFIAGSAMFFFPELETIAIWFFLVGSVCFALKPTLRLARELHYLYIGDAEDVATELKYEP